MKNIKKLIASALLALFIGLQSVPVYADGSVGDPNIDSGGGGMQSGTSTNFWYQTDDGVRVTIVDAKTGEEKSGSIDYTNQHPNDIQFHFGKNSKRDYTGGMALTAATGTYTYKNPAQALPIIVSDGEYYVSNIDEIRSYFTDEQVVKAIASDMGFKFDDLINGDYKLMIEPIVYITYEKGIRKGHIMGAVTIASIYIPLSDIVGKREAVNMIAEAMKPASVAKHDKIEKLPAPIYMKVAGFITSKMFSEKAGFRRRWHCDTKYEKRYELLTCPYVETFKELGCPEVCPAVCIQDDLSFGNMKNGVIFERKGTLGRGDECCDFKFVCRDADDGDGRKLTTSI